MTKERRLQIDKGLKIVINQRDGCLYVDYSLSIDWWWRSEDRWVEKGNHAGQELSINSVNVFTARRCASVVLAVVLRPSVRPSRAGIVSKRLNFGSRKQRHK